MPLCVVGCAEPNVLGGNDLICAYFPSGTRMTNMIPFETLLFSCYRYLIVQFHNIGLLCLSSGHWTSSFNSLALAVHESSIVIEF